MGNSRGRHVATRPASRKAMGFVAGGAGILLVGGVLVSGAVAAASSQSADHTAAQTSAATSIFDLKGFAKGPAKVAPTPTFVPKTVLDPNAVADPYYMPPAPAPAAPAPAAPAPAPPAPAPSGTGTPGG